MLEMVITVETDQFTFSSKFGIQNFVEEIQM